MIKVCKWLHDSYSMCFDLQKAEIHCLVHRYHGVLDSRDIACYSPRCLSRRTGDSFTTVTCKYALFCKNHWVLWLSRLCVRVSPYRIMGRNCLKSLVGTCDRFRPCRWVQSLAAEMHLKSPAQHQMISRGRRMYEGCSSFKFGCQGATPQQVQSNPWSNMDARQHRSADRALCFEWRHSLGQSVMHRA